MTRISYEAFSDGVVSIRLTRPEKRNAIDLPLADELIEALQRFAKDESARAAVLSGEGDGFCAGGDITMFPNLNTEAGLEFVKGIGARIQDALAKSRKPIIAAVHGFCLAGGFELALACHMIYASRDTRFAMREVRLGLIPGWGGTVRLARATSPGIAQELLLTGRSIDAAEARDIGVVVRVLDNRDACLAAARETAAAAAAAPALAIESVLAVVRAAHGDAEDAFSLEQSYVAMLFGNEATQARIQSTLNRGVGTTSAE